MVHKPPSTIVPHCERGGSGRCKRQQQDDTGTAGERRAGRREKQRIDGGDREPGRRQGAGEQADAGHAKRQPKFLAVWSHYPGESLRTWHVPMCG